MILRVILRVILPCLLVRGKKIKLYFEIWSNAVVCVREFLSRDDRRSPNRPEDPEYLSI